MRDHRPQQVFFRVKGNSACAICLWRMSVSSNFTIIALCLVIFAVKAMH